MLYTIVVPVYESEKTILELYDRIKKKFEENKLLFELILVEDCSSDNSWNEIQLICNIDNRVKGLKLSRNFGQHYAITAGLDQGRGDWYIVMDCDLQDQPEEIQKLLQKSKEGFDIVLAKRTNRQDGFLKKSFSKLFYHSLGYLSGSYQDSSVANFGIYNKKVIDSIKSMRESIRYFPTMVRWVGFKMTTVEINHARRNIGKTSYNYKKLFDLGLDIILAYSDKPLRIIIKLGLFTSFLAICFTILTIIQYLSGEIVVTGYTSLIISIWLLSGIIISILGIVGLYVGKTFEGVKKRPIYLIDQKLNLSDEK